MFCDSTNSISINIDCYNCIEEYTYRNLSILFCFVHKMSNKSAFPVTDVPVNRTMLLLFEIKFPFMKVVVVVCYP